MTFEAIAYRRIDRKMAESNENNNGETFLSRVFGLHSVYNQIQDNYEYYDPEAEYQQEEEDSGGASFRANKETLKSNNEGGMVHSIGNNDRNRTTYLDSESDLDLSLSLSSPPSPMLPYAYDEEQASKFAKAKMEQSDSEAGRVHWDMQQSHYSGDGDVWDDNEDLTTVRSPRRNFFDRFSRDKKNQSQGLPLYNEQIPVRFRKPPSTFEPSVQTKYQKLHRTSRRPFVIPPKERALYLWANITNMDEFLIDVYYYYRGKGLLNIVLSRMVDLLILVFTLAFTVFLKWGINYDYFFSDKHSDKGFTKVTLSDLIVKDYMHKRVPLSVKLILTGFAGYIVLRLVQLYFDLRYKLREVRNFYQQLLGVSDNELMTISWTVIVERLMHLKDYNSLTSSNRNKNNIFLSDLSSKVRLNAHDIANRIMRKENYMIALVNKDVLDLSVNVPVFSKFKNVLSAKSVLTKTLEWNLKLCIINFVFNQQGQIDPKILKDFNRNKLAAELSSRFRMAAIINLILCPFIVIYFVLLYFYRYFNEYKSNPSSILGLRQYTPWAEWKLREFNELPHFFIKRLHLSVGPANIYINQFPRGFLAVNLMNLVNFIAGAITAILVIMGFWLDNEERNFWSFEITENKSSLFYISVFGTIWAVTSNSLTSTSSDSSENLNTQTSSFFYDPEASLRYVSQFTHYLPSSWNGRLHTVEVKNEFCGFYSLKIILILNEILSSILTPFILWFKVLNSSGAIIDFFREYSIHVDGLGYVCYFAMFNFEEKDKNMMKNAVINRRKNKASKHKSSKHPPDFIELNVMKPPSNGKLKLADDASSSDDSISDILDEHYEDDKMIKSYMYFLESYGNKSQDPPHGKKMKNNMPNNFSSVEQPKPVRSSGPLSDGPLNHPSSISTSIADISFGMRNTVDDDEEDRKQGRKSGMLGMLNQFYKQDMKR